MISYVLSCFPMFSGVFWCSQLFYDVFSWLVTFMDNHPSVRCITNPSARILWGSLYVVGNLGQDQDHPWVISFFSTRYHIHTIWGFFLNTIRYPYHIRASKKTFFLRNFRQIFRIFGEFLEFSALLLLRTLVPGFSEFSGNFLNFRRIFGTFGEFSAKKNKINHNFSVS